MKRIGFIDWFLDEWHANNYPEWIRHPARNHGTDGGKRFEVTQAWAAIDKPGGLSTDAWCARFGVERAPSIEALIDACDGIVVLAPDHAEKHAMLSELALRSGKPVYIDKTFATGRREAQQLFALAHEYGTPLYSTSALRYASELETFKRAGLVKGKVTLASTRGPGVIGGYGIHQAEMIVSLMGIGWERVLMTGPNEAPTFVFAFSEGRTAVMQHLPWSGFSIVAHGEGGGMDAVIEKDFWSPFTDELLHFFETGIPPVPEAETIEAVSMIEAALRAMKQPGIWVEA